MSLDYLSDKMASHKLARTIMKFWSGRGHIVKAWTEKATDPSNGTFIWVVRTNIEQDASKISPNYTII